MSITEHHDGHQLNERIYIGQDDKGPGGGSHRYTFLVNGDAVGTLQFQNGPRLDPASRPGVTESAVIAVLLDRLRDFQHGPFPSAEGARAVISLSDALAALKDRTNLRAARGVL